MKDKKISGGNYKVNKKQIPRSEDSEFLDKEVPASTTLHNLYKYTYPNVSNQKIPKQWVGKICQMQTGRKSK